MEQLRFRAATDGDVECVAEILHGAPGPEVVALLGGEERARRFGFARARLQATGRAWRRTLLAERDGRPVAALQWRPGSEPALPLSLALVRAAVRALGLAGAAAAWRRDRMARRVNPPPPADAFHVEELHVLPDLRGHGIGGALLAQAETLARKEGFHRMSLVTHKENPAQGLYRRAGFVEVERRVDPDYERLTGIPGRLLMVKPLAPSV
jgi:ribosomal protein S18 acetylase RimI-like enzyme